jgi:hypothetical protein
MPSKVIRTENIKSTLEKIISKGFEIDKEKELKDFWNHFSIKSTLKSLNGKIKFLGTHSSECKDTIILRSKDKSLLDKLSID